MGKKKGSFISKIQRKKFLTLVINRIYRENQGDDLSASVALKHFFTAQ